MYFRSLLQTSGKMEQETLPKEVAVKSTRTSCWRLKRTGSTPWWKVSWNVEFAGLKFIKAVPIIAKDALTRKESAQCAGRKSSTRKVTASRRLEEGDRPEYSDALLPRLTILKSSGSGVAGQTSHTTNLKSYFRYQNFSLKNIALIKKFL